MVHYRCLIHTAEGDFFPLEKFSLTLPVLSQDIQSQNEKFQNSQPQSHPRRPRGGQSGREKRREREYKRKSPWVPTLTGPFPNSQANAGS